VSTETLAATPRRGLTVEQVELLLRMISEARVRQQKGNDHLEAWDVRRWLTRIFGFAGWSEECRSETLVHERIVPQKEEGKFRTTAVYRVGLRLHLRDVWGNELGYFDGAAVGESVNQPSIGDAHDNALKTAYSQALKRCAIDLGDQFGLSLYSKTRRQDALPVVAATAGHPLAVSVAELGEIPADAPVTSGELDEQQEAAPAPTVREPKPAQSRAQRGPQDNTEWEQPAPGPDSTKGQHIAISKLFLEKCGVTSAQRDRKLAGVRYFLGVDVPSTTKLSHAQAVKLIEILSGLAPFAGAPSEAEQASAAQAEAQRLAPGEPSQVERAESDLRDRIEAAESGEELDGVIAAVLAQSGWLSQQVTDALLAAADLRARALGLVRQGAAS
jgi:hypothetical protein